MIKNPFRYEVHVWEPKEKPLIIPHVDEVKKDWKKNKVIPNHLENIIYKALAHYPELKDTYIIVVETKFYGIQHSLRSYPPLLSLLNKRKNRVYPVVINTNKNIPNSFYTLPENEQLGVLAHEFAHTIDYTNRTSPQIVGYAINWLSKKFVRDIEHATDKTAISRGCGNNLLCYREKILELVNPKLENYLEQTYLKPEEIINEERSENLPTGKIDSSWIEYENKKYIKPDPKVIGGVFYGIVTTLSFIPAVSQMIYLIWIRKMHKKPNWYN